MNTFKPIQIRISLVIFLLALSAINSKNLIGSEFATAKLLRETVIRADQSNHADKKEIADLNLISTDSTNKLNLLNSNTLLLKKNEEKAGNPLIETTQNIFIPTFQRYLIDIGCGGEGDMYGIGVQNDLHLYDFNNDMWNLVPLGENISNNLIRVDVDKDGTPFVVTLCGIYYLDNRNNWVKLPGSGMDIGVGVNKDVYMVGGAKLNYQETTFGPNKVVVEPSDVLNKCKTGKCTTTINTNYGLWKLICKSEGELNRLRSQTLKVEAQLGQNYRDCFWFRLEGDGIAVDVLPNGNAVIARAQGGVWIYDLKENSFTQLPISDIENSKLMKAIDVTVGNHSIIYAVSSKDDKTLTNNEGGRIYRYNESETRWDDLKIKSDLGTGVAEDIYVRRVCVSAYEQVSFIRYSQKNLEDKQVFTSTRFSFLY